MTLKEFVNSKGLRVSTVSQQMGVSRQALDNYGTGDYYPTVKTLKKIAQALTDLGAPTTVVELVAAVYGDGVDNTNVGGEA